MHASLKRGRKFEKASNLPQSGWGEEEEMGPASADENDVKIIGSVIAVIT